MAMKVIKKTESYTIYQRGDNRYAIKDADKKPVNGDDKVRILVEEGLLKVAAPPAPEPEPVEEQAAETEEAVAEEAAEEAPAEEAAEEAPAEDAAGEAPAGEATAEEATAEEPAEESPAEEPAEEAPAEEPVAEDEEKKD